jgi:hypothetical protein
VGSQIINEKQHTDLYGGKAHPSHVILDIAHRTQYWLEDIMSPICDNDARYRHLYGAWFPKTKAYFHQEV